MGIFKAPKLPSFIGNLGAFLLLKIYSQVVRMRGLFILVKLSIPKLEFTLTNKNKELIDIIFFMGNFPVILYLKKLPKLL